MIGFHGIHQRRKSVSFDDTNEDDLERDGMRIRKSSLISATRLLSSASSQSDLSTIQVTPESGKSATGLYYDDEDAYSAVEGGEDTSNDSLYYSSGKSTKMRRLSPESPTHSDLSIFDHDQGGAERVEEEEEDEEEMYGNVLNVTDLDDSSLDVSHDDWDLLFAPQGTTSSTSIGNGFVISDAMRSLFKTTAYGWKLPSRYNIRRLIGNGSYGDVAEAYDTHTKSLVAIKRVPEVFKNKGDAIRIYREIVILRNVRHDNIIQLIDIIEPEKSDTFDEIYLVFQKMDTDLHKLLLSPQPLVMEHIQIFMFQVWICYHLLRACSLI